MPRPDIPAAKRAGLPVDLNRLTREGDDWLSAEERYALKTHGVCAQAQPGVFMIRVRVPGGSLHADAARRLADLAQIHGKGWLHLTTRQQIELHHVPANEVTRVLDAVVEAGLSTQSACGHTVRGVMACPDAGVGIDEPFDCRPDAQLLSAWLMARAGDLDTRLPSRLNIAFGGCPECREHARLNDLAFVSVVRDGEPGYEVWLGGSLGRSVPTLATKAIDFLPRVEVLAVVDALVRLYVAEGNFDQPAKARLKFLVRKMGVEQFLERFHDALAAVRDQDAGYPSPPQLPAAPATHLEQMLDHAPRGGWRSGVRPQHAPGQAMVTVNVPLGDLDAVDLRGLADLADTVADGGLVITRNQNLMLRHVAVESVPLVRERLAVLGLSVEGADQATDVRSCTGGPVCSLAITPAQATGSALIDLPALRRNSGLRVHVSGCPNACAQHQIADLGLSGGKVTIGGQSQLGYQVWMGGDIGAGRVGKVVGRVASSDVPAVASAVVGVWEALRRRGEPLSETVERIGTDGFAAHIERVFTGRWESGPEPEVTLDVDERLLAVAR